MSTKFVLFSDIHEHAVFSPRALLDKRFFGLMNSTFCRRGDYRMERVDDAVRTILDTLRPDLVVFPGDVVSTSDPREFEAALKQLRPLIDSGMPILFSPGNHDRYVRDRACREAFEYFLSELTKHCPMTLPGVYETADLRFAVIDCARPFTPVLSCGEMTPETADFLEREAAKDDPRPLVCVGHFPLHGNEKWKSFRHRLINYERAEALLNAGKIALSVAGHIHVPFQHLDARGYGELVVGSLTKHDILREITFDGGVFTVRDLYSNGQPRN
ncbi:MAG: metallophosphoesterase [Lentisphaeria bacterium]|nr:metallophosphoesterase [Lentisphaeria bacterium]